MHNVCLFLSIYPLISLTTDTQRKEAVAMDFEEPQTETIPPENILSFPRLLKSFDCAKVDSWQELKVLHHYFASVLTSLKELSIPFSCSSIVSGDFHGFIGWFDVRFEGSEKTIILSTSPDSGYYLTHIPLYLITIQCHPLEANHFFI